MDSYTLESLSNDDGDVNENSKKAIDLDWQNNNSARAPRFFVYFLIPSLHDSDVKMPNFTFRYSLLELNSKIWRIEWDRISAIKFETSQLHFLSDVFVAIAVVVV